LSPGGRELSGLLYCDLAGVVRGRFVPIEEVEQHLDSGIGWVPANQAVNLFGELAEPNPFGAVGDVRLRPDPETRVHVGFQDRPPLDFLLCDAVRTDGSAWDCCARTLLIDRLKVLAEETGGRLNSTFEHEFQLLADYQPGAPFSLSAMRRVDWFPQHVVGALMEAGVEPETFLPEYGPRQFEVPTAPAIGVRSADRSVVVREVVREVARISGYTASFSPLCTPGGVGNGVHIHFSLVDPQGRSVLYDGSRPGELSELGGAFAAGILEHAGALIALTAPSGISQERFKPHNWAASQVILGLRNREAALRICPGSSLGGGDPWHQYNLEFRAADAAANPYLALAGIINAGLDGVRRGLPAPPVVEEDVEGGEPLVAGLGAALGRLRGDGALLEGWSEDLIATYAAVKESECRTIDGLDPDSACELYRQAI
jgi:glutamine synthetase